MKKLFIEILVIVVLSSLVGLVYNFFSSKPLPLIRTEDKIKTVSDSHIDSLLGGNDQNKATSQLPAATENKVTPTESNDKPVSDIPINPKVKDTAASKEKNQVGKKEFNTVTYKQILGKLNDDRVLIIDARTPEDYKESHIGNAININPHDENQDLYFRTITTLPMDKLIIVYCSGGTCDASHKVVEDLLSFGYKKVLLYEGGWTDWAKNKGLKK